MSDASDAGAVFWKEWREILEQFGSFRRGGLAIVALVLMFGIVLPWMMGPMWVSSPVMLGYWAFVGGSFVINVIIDAFAGERERHTLETLLASPLSDRGILLGKYLAAVTHGVVLVALNLLVGLATVNVTHHGAGLLVWQPLRLLQILVLTTLWAAFVSGVGVIISLRAATARQAHQTFGIAIIVILLAPTIALELLPPATQARAQLWWQTMQPAPLAWRVAFVLLLLDALALWAASKRFRRGRLVLD